MLVFLLSTALGHAPVHETLGRLDTTDLGDARRSAHLLLHQGKPHAALAVVHPTDHSTPALLLRAEAAVQLGRIEALGQLERVILVGEPVDQARALELRADLDPTRAWTDMAHAVLLVPTPERALRAAALSPSPPAALAMVAHARDQLGPSAVLDQALAEAWINVGEPLQALPVLEGSSGRTTAGRLLQARALDQAGQSHEARALRDALLVDLDRRLQARNSPLLHLSKARCLLALDRTDEARAVLDYVLQTAPDLAAARTLLASLEPV